MAGSNWGHAFFQAAIERQIDQAREEARRHGWSFAERGLHQHTIGDTIGAVMAIATPQEAKLFYDGYVRFIELLPASERSDQYTPEEVARANIGWCFGEGMTPERRAMWVEACGAAHPVFGAMDPPPTPEEAFQAGVRYGEERRP